MYKSYFFFFFNDTATTEIYTLSLHDALPISTGSLQKTLEGHSSYVSSVVFSADSKLVASGSGDTTVTIWEDRKSTRLNSSHGYISYAVFCLKKKHTSHRYKVSGKLYRVVCRD